MALGVFLIVIDGREHGRYPSLVLASIKGRMSSVV